MDEKNKIPELTLTPDLGTPLSAEIKEETAVAAPAPQAGSLTATHPLCSMRALRSSP